MADDKTQASPINVDEILGDIKSMMGFVPPALGAVAADPGALRAAWWATRCGYLENPLPPLFKEQFMAVIGRYQLSPYSLIVRSCSLRRMGMSPQEVVALLKMKVPRQATIIDELRTQTASWRSESGWANMPRAAEQWVLWAAVRMTLRRDPAGRCRKAMHEVLGEILFNKVVMLVTFAAMQRVWIDSHPDVDPAGDARVQEQYRDLLAQAPEFAGVWNTLVKRAGHRRITPRERKLMAEIARQDAVRQKLRDSETRFRRVVQNAAYPVMIYAQDGEVIMLNREWTSLSGWTRKRIASIQTWMERAEVDNKDWSPEDMDALEGWHEPIEEGEHRIRTRDGQIRKWEFSTAALGKLADGRNAFMRMATDVTVRRELETALRATHERVTHILESIRDAFIAFDPEHRMIWMNTEGARMFGCDRDAVIGRKFEDVFPSVVSNPIYETLMRCMAEKQTLHFEAFSPVVGLPLELHAYGSDEGLTIYFHDISERKQMESALQLANQHLSGVLGSIKDGFVALDREHHVTWMNQKAAEMLRIDRDAAMGKPLEDVLPPQANADVTRQMIKCMEDGGTMHLEYFSNAIQAPIEMHAYGWEGGLSVHFRDISARKDMEDRLRASEKHFRSVFESDMMGIFFTNRFSGAVIECNDAFLKIIGYSREDLREGRINRRDLTPPEWREADAVATKALERGPAAPWEKEYIHKLGHRVPVMVGGVPVSVGNEMVMAFVVDLTAEKQAHRRSAELTTVIEAVVRTIPSPVCIFDRDAKVIYWNDAAGDRFGWKLEEIVGKRNPLVPEAMWSAFDQQIRRVFAGETLSPSDLPCTTRSGSVLLCSFDAMPVRDKEGSVVAAMGIVRPSGQS